MSTPKSLDWHLTLCRVDRAWEQFGGRDKIAWDGIVIGQLDTGYTPHPAFGPKTGTWVRKQVARTFFWSGMPGGAAGSVGEPGMGLDPLTGLHGGHGTKTGSTIVGFDAEPMFCGVAPRAPLVPVRISDVVVIDLHEADFVAGLDYLVDEVKATVVNISLGMLVVPAGPNARRAVDNAYDKGTILVCAAGNTPIPPTVLAPARLSRTLAVAGVGPGGVPWSGSSYGDSVDLSAPASAVRHGATQSIGNYRYEVGEGTSYAAAMVSGAAALWLARHRDILGQRYSAPWQRVEAFRQAVVASSFVPAGTSWKQGFGAGILDVDAALDPSRLADAASLIRDEPNI